MNLRFTICMKRLAKAALIFNLGAAGIYAQQGHVKMKFSGTLEPSPTSLQPNTNTDAEDIAGSGTLGRFTFRDIRADVAAPQASSTCSGPDQFYFPTVAGAGVFRFEDGSLLIVKITQGSACIDFAAGQGYFTEVFEITGGSGRFKKAAGTLTMTETLIPVLYTSSDSVVLLAATGEFKGSISGVASDDDEKEERR